MHLGASLSESCRNSNREVSGRSCEAMGVRGVKTMKRWARAAYAAVKRRAASKRRSAKDSSIVPARGGKQLDASPFSPLVPELAAGNHNKTMWYIYKYIYIHIYKAPQV